MTTQKHTDIRNFLDQVDRSWMRVVAAQAKVSEGDLFAVVDDGAEISDEIAFSVRLIGDYRRWRLDSGAL